MNIYFAGSITGGRQDLGIYQELQNHLLKYGKVLIMQVANPIVSGKGNPVDNNGSMMSASDVHNRDIASIQEADAFVAEITVPSLGVGYEIGTAEAKGIPILLLYRKIERGISPVVVGNRKFLCFEYSEIGDAFAKIDEFFEKIIE